MKFSCYGCDKRHAACHATCETYKKEKAAHEAQKEKEWKEKKVQRGLNDHAVTAIERNRKRMGVRWNGKEGRNVE